MTPDQYDAWYDTPRGRWIGETEWRLIRSRLEPQPRHSVLDVGCGTGWFTRRVAADTAQVVGLDRDAAALAFARQHSAGQARYVHGDATCLPFTDGSFDAVMSITALCFVEQWPRAVAEIVRVSRHRFVLGLLNRNSMLWLRKGRGGGQGAYHGAHWHTRAEIATVLNDLPVREVHYSFAVFMPSAGTVARAVEPWLPSAMPLGSFMVVAGIPDAR